VLSRNEQLRFDGFTSSQAFRDYFKTRYGRRSPPTAASPMTAALDHDLIELARAHGCRFHRDAL